MTEDRAGFEAVADEGDIKEGGLLGVEVGGQRLVLAKLDGRVYAIGGVCTHMGGDLPQGKLEGETLRCPVHRGGFNIKTGEAVMPPPRRPEPVYDVMVEDGRIWVSRKPRA
jgi:nitrite reductase/ring-hydroxylating ferredoxin subunit